MKKSILNATSVLGVTFTSLFLAACNLQEGAVTNSLQKEGPPKEAEIGLGSNWCGFEGFKDDAPKGLAKSATIANTTPPFGRPNWGPHTAGLSKRQYTWSIKKNYSETAYISDAGTGTRYTRDASNAFVEAELKKVMATWASVINVQFKYQTDIAAEVTFEWLNNTLVPAWTATCGNDCTSNPRTGATIIFSEHDLNWSEVNGTLGRIYALGLHEVGHFLGLGHAFLDDWDYAYPSTGSTTRPCVSGGRCKYPVVKTPTVNHAIMSYHFGADLGRHVHHRVLTDYDIDYAVAKYGAPEHDPLIEMWLPAKNEFFYTNNWQEASEILTSYSNSSTLTSTASVTNFVGAIRYFPGNPVPAPSGWLQLHRYVNNSTGKHRYLASTGSISTPSGHSDEGVMGYTKETFGGAYNAILSEYYSSSLNTSKFRTSSTPPPSGYSFIGYPGYIIRQVFVGAY